MENASKALLMAAGVLIGVLILSLAVYLFVTFGTSSAELHKQIEANRLNEFNSQFTSLEGKDDITIYDVITIANLAKENNEYYELDTESNNNFYIKVYLEGVGALEKKSKADLDQIIKNNLPTNDQVNKYSCTVKINPSTGRVNYVKFE